MSIKAIFLDFYGTVVHDVGEVIYEVSLEIQAASSIKDISITEIATYWWNQFYHLFTKSYGVNFLSQRQVEIISIQKTLTHFQAPLDALILSEKMFDQWKRPTMYADAISFFAIVDLPVYILSNVDREELMEALKYHEIEVNGVITSEDVRSYKPRPDMFEEALRLGKVRAEEVLHVGDSLTQDVLGAQKLGIKSVWLNRNNQMSLNEIEPDFVVNDLTDVISLWNRVNV
ncbi:HAD family hydrolase [Alkalihalobacillus sp. 1P02AB]|uniref:HAD family hydrolase n=1 Tax=Alkalihalobacillus sp. 1P02AB TaxID=3132260 RepID=UPI0039A4EF46